MPDIERKNCAIKERAISLISTFLFKKIPGWIIIELIPFVGLWRNQETPDNGVSDVYYPQNMIMVQALSYYKQFKFMFGSYGEVH